MTEKVTLSEEALLDYLEDLESSNNERERVQRFIEFFRRDLEVGPEFIGYPTEIRPGLEESLAGTEKGEQVDRRLTEFTGDVPGDISETEEETVFLRGRLDARVGNLIMEFKDDLDADLDDAENQLRKYVYLLRHQGINADFICFATDGKVFRPYEAIISEPFETRDDVRLSPLPVGDLDLGEMPTSQVERWFRSIVQEKVHPLIETLDNWFGIDSPIYEEGMGVLERAFDESPISEIYFDEWKKYLRYAHGEVPEEGRLLFLRHTYLGTFAKILTYLVFVRGSVPTPDEASRVVRGDVEGPFPDRLFERDLFSWVGRTDQSNQLMEVLLDALLNFNLGEVDQDIFKHLYQEMVSPDVRHDLGEYYTPNWLARHTLTTLELGPNDQIIDPGCGSGTFLVEAIHEKKRKLSDLGYTPAEIIEEIIDDVVGIDVHPLATGVAKANYMASIKDLLQFRRGPLRIPIYLADSVVFQQELEGERQVDLTELEQQEVVRGPIRIGDYEYWLPEVALRSPSKLDRSLDLAQSFVHDRDGFARRLSEELPGFEDLIPIFQRVREKMADAEERGRDSIHAYILKNFFRPLYLSESSGFDAIVGNPPWLSYRYMSGEQQKRVSTLLDTYGLYPGPENVTQMELATLFAARSVDLYLRPQGKLGFVMPRSIFSANQHDPFRRTGPQIPFRLTSVIDLDGVNPLFNVPASVIFAVKEGTVEYPIKKEVISGELPSQDPPVEEAFDVLKFEDSEVFLHGNGVTSWDEIPPLERTAYYPDFLNGATLYPRALVLAQLQDSAKEFGYNAVAPPVRSSDHAQATSGESNQGIEIKASVESQFIHETLLSTDLVSFAHREPRPAVIPAIPKRDSYEVISAARAGEAGFSGLKDWLDQANRHWDGEGSRAEFSDQLDYRNKITRQDPSAEYKVIYIASGSNLVAAIYKREENQQRGDLQTTTFIADHKTYTYETDDEDEAYYLLAVLNAPCLNEMIENLQSRGEFGARDIHKKPLEFPIPRFNPEDDDHQTLVQLGRQAEEKAEQALPEAEERYSHIGWIRKVVREAVEDEMAGIDRIVAPLLQVDDRGDSSEE